MSAFVKGRSPARPSDGVRGRWLPRDQAVWQAGHSFWIVGLQQLGVGPAL